MDPSLLDPNLMQCLGIHLVALDECINEIADLASNTPENVRVQIFRASLRRYAHISTQELGAIAKTISVAANEAVDPLVLPETGEPTPF